MKAAIYTLGLLVLIIVTGAVLSTFQNQAPKSRANDMANIAPQININAQNSTSLIGQILFRYGNDNFHSGVKIFLKDSYTNQTQILISDQNGLFRAPFLSRGAYEITRLEYEESAKKINFALICGIFFEIKENAVNNLGLIEWTAQNGEHNLKYTQNYDAVKAAFAANSAVSSSIWIDTALSSTAPFSAQRAANDGAWDISKLDTARNAPYLSAVEKDVVLETNKVRSDPKKYAELYIKPMLSRYNGTLYSAPNELPQKSIEGEKAARECYEVLMRANGLQILYPSPALSRAAADHAADQSKSAQLGHTGSDGSQPTDRVLKYAKNYKRIGENIAYGPNDAREIVVGLLIDDGVPSRGHRDTILQGSFDQIGVSTASHKHYGVMCVIEYAQSY